MSSSHHHRKRREAVEIIVPARVAGVHGRLAYRCRLAVVSASIISVLKNRRVTLVKHRW